MQSGFHRAMGSLAACLFLACSVHAADLKSVVEQFIREQTRGQHDSVAVEVRTHLPAAIGSRGDVCRVNTSGAMVLRGNIMLPVEVTSSGTERTTVLVSVKVRTFDAVCIASRQLGRHEAVDAAGCRMAQMETTALPPDIVRSPDQLLGRWTKRIVSEGEVLNGSLLEIIPCLRQGAVVTLKVRTKAVVISTEAIAREDGREGESVLVQKAGTHERLRARVANEKTVEMRLD